METDEKTENALEMPAVTSENSKAENSDISDGKSAESGAQDEIKALAARVEEQCGQIEELNIKLFDAKTRLALLLAGIAKEKLDESAALAAAICKSGKTSDEAAAEIASAYPHLRAVKRDIPQFSVSALGEDDGFSAVRGIFSKR